MGKPSGGAFDAERRLAGRPLSAPAQALGLDNPEWDASGPRFLIVRLSPFRDACRSTSHLFLHRLARSVFGGAAYVDFCFFPSKAERAALDELGLPWLAGVASGRPACDFDAVLVSCSYALELVNLPLVLLKSGIPPLASQRNAAPSPSGRPWPSIVLGGSNALASQGAIFPDGDSFVDGIFFGEAEDGGDRLLESLARTAGLPPAERAVAAEAATDAFWAALRGPPGKARERPVRPGRCAASEGRVPLLLDSYPLLNSEEASTARLQVSWGCPAFCSFCFEGWERKPYRELPAAEVLAAARRLKAATGASTVEVYSFNFNAHSSVLSLVRDLNGIFDKVNMMSQRADLLNRVPGMLQAELAAEKRSFTVGVEGISAAMRAYYAKGLETADLLSVIGKIAAARARELKLFYIISGEEDEDDLQEFDRFCAWMADVKAENHPGLRVLFSAGFLVRMPFTPLSLLETEPPSRAVLEEVASRLKASAEARRFEFRLASDWEEYAADRLLVSGGYGLARGLLEAARAGCAYDLGIEGKLLSFLEKAERDDQADGSRPLSFVRASVDPAFLAARSEAAAARREEPSCFGSFRTDASCSGCAACADADERRFMSSHAVAGAPSYAFAEELERTIKAKRRRAPLYAAVDIPAALAGAHPEFLAAWLLRACIAARPALADELLRVEEALWASPAWRGRVPAGLVGKAVVAVHASGGEGGTTRPRPETAKLALEALTDATGAPAVALPAFDPAAIASARLEIDLGPGPDGKAAARARAWLAGMKIAATEHKTETGRAFAIAPKDLKKRAVLAIEVEGRALKAACGPKLDLSALFSRAYDAGAARVRVTELSFPE